MSWETQAWAGRQRPGSASMKLVLLGLASCGDANHQAHPSIDWLCQFGDLNRKTVITALDRLAEAGLIADTGLRRGRTAQVKVYRLAVGDVTGEARLGADPASATVPKSGQSQKRNGSENGTVPKAAAKSPKNGTRNLSWEPNTPSPSDEGETPLEKIDEGEDQGGEDTPPEPAAEPAPAKAHRLPDDWAPPPVTDLSAAVQARLREWPAGAYEAVCETFRLHWLSETRAIGRKSNWTAALGKWLLNDHSKVMRDAKHGVSFVALAPASGKPIPAVQPTPAKSREDRWSATVHAILKRDVGETVWASRFSVCAVLLANQDQDGIAVTVVAPSEFQRNYLEANCSQTLREAVKAATGIMPAVIRFEVERAKETADA